jgi:hypothetical protein
MKKALAVLAVSAAAALGFAPAVPATPVAHASCVNARTPGGVKCLGAGEFCSHKPGYAAAYRRAGFKCKANGHLAYR